MIQDRPVCYRCDLKIESDPVFAPPFCDDEECSSAVFHGICLMQWREHLDSVRQEVKKRQERHEARECGCYDEQGNDVRGRRHE